MTTKKTTEGVGKKIVEALKKQAETLPSSMQVEEPVFEETPELQDIAIEEPNEIDVNNEIPSEINNEINEESFQSTLLNTVPFQSEPEELKPLPEPILHEIHETKTDNVKVLSDLINKLPAGISKQTGAQIIRQTMEALGISMKTVLEEAQQIQEQISRSSNNCINSIQEYKKQILAMEKQVQTYHKQYNALNELISLFVQTGI